MDTEADSVIGTIQLTRTTRLVFSVRPWKAKCWLMSASSCPARSTKATLKSGMAMRGEVLMSVIDALTSSKRSLQGPRKINSPKFIRLATSTSSSP